ncbi:MAG: hypothetical protein HYV63_18405 [Candidatus Schekmanbacteria bacterium]|nr:hypothetical protein [Candidatus Schekmanbacteria bacterium]
MLDSDFEASVRHDPGCTEITLKGTIDEDSPQELDRAFRDLGPRVRICFREVTKINSCGIEELMKVLHEVANEHKVEFAECPEVIVDQFQMMDFSMYGRITSFFIRYLCDKCAAEKMLLLDVDRDLRIDHDTREVEAPTFDCSCGGTLRIDDYLDFLDDHIDW